MQIDEIISDDRINMETYGVQELRDGFFDAFFLAPKPVDLSVVAEVAKTTLPKEFDKSHPLSAKHFLPRQFHEMASVAHRVATTRAGIKLIKSFLAFFVAYVLCLVQPVHSWLGRYDYIMVVSVIINHSGRSFGSQLDGAVLTIVGTAVGLGWGSVGLLLSTSTDDAREGYGWILAAFSIVLFASIAFLRAFFIRFYQPTLSAGIALAFTTLAETRSGGIEWYKLRNYAVPWALGQAIALAVNCLVFPDAGNHSLAVALDKSFKTMQESLVIPRPRDVRAKRRLAKAFMDMSHAYRDMRIDLTITRFHPLDVRELRNAVQGVVRALLSMNTDTDLFEEWDNPVEITVADISGGESTYEDSGRKVAQTLSGPTREVIACMTEAIDRCHAALMDLTGWRKQIGPPKDVSSDIVSIQLRMKDALEAFDAAETRLLTSKDRPDTYAEHGQAVELFVFARHARETAATIVHLMAHVHHMQTHSSHTRFNLPTYPPAKALYRTNAQVRHDRGGVTAGMYMATFKEIAHLISLTNMSEGHQPHLNLHSFTGKRDYDSAFDVAGEKKFRYRTWLVLRRLQGIESKYALKVALLTLVLALPGWLGTETGWWNAYEAWWATCLGWITMHPRVGGNIQDFFTRASIAILGAAWSGAAHAAGRGNPYVLAVFAAIYMIPMMYRFTQSKHPRSGLVGCLSFTVISLSLRNHSAEASVTLLGVHKGIAFLVGTIAPIIVNWMLWPFVARHELRGALSVMLFYMSIMYRNVVANYVYFDEGKSPTPEDIRRSEMLESRMREGFVRIRQLLVMTRHEIRLRGPFDPVPYSCLAASCERFFEYLIAVRQSALFYNPNYIRDNPVAAEKLFTYRRDAVAAILSNLYTLSGALKHQKKVPRYLPSAAAARKRLLRKTEEVVKEMEENVEYPELERQKTWSDIYSYSYNESLTGCVAQLEELEQFTKLIVGEKRFEGKKHLDYYDEDTDVSLVDVTPERLN
ncbi:Zinc finger protein containing five transmembrane domains [Fusarium chlamydosporum]